MAISDKIPLAKAGDTKRNAIVAIIYFILLPIIIIALPFYLLFAIGTNRNGMGDAVANSPLGSIPGVGSGGWSAGVVVFIAVFVVFGAIGAMVPADDTNDDAPGPDLSGDGDNLSDAADSGDDGEETDDSGNDGGEGDDNTDETDSDEDGGDDTTPDDTSGETTDTPETTEEEEPEPELTQLSSILDVSDRHDESRETFSGTGDDVTETFHIGGIFTAFTFEHSGESNFIVTAIDGNGEETILVNEIGAINGATGQGLPAGEYQFDIQADGDWEIEAAEPFPEEEEIHEVPVEASGEGKDVIGPVNIDGTVTVEGTHNGESNFIVEIVHEDAADRYSHEIVFNEIGEYEGRNTASGEGISWIVVDADGEWSLTIE